MADIGGLQGLAALIRRRNSVDGEIAELIGRPALIGHVGEYLAAEIFDIRLHESAVHKGSDGYFADGCLAGKSVNIKFYSANSGLLDIARQSPPDYYLVLTGARTATTTSRGETRPWGIDAAFLFNHAALVSELSGRVKIGVETSVRRHYWDAAEVYPSGANPELRLTPCQIETLKMFSTAN